MTTSRRVSQPRKAKAQHSVIHTHRHTDGNEHDDDEDSSTLSSHRVSSSTFPDHTTVVDIGFCFLLAFEDSVVVVNMTGRQREPSHTKSPRRARFTFQCCTLRAARALPPVRTIGIPPSTLAHHMTVRVGDFVLLQPAADHQRPGVARVRAFSRGHVDVEWMYRGEDVVLGVGMVTAPGDDEVFETRHTDTLDADTIKGRCVVLSYPQYVACLAHPGQDLPQHNARVHRRRIEVGLAADAHGHDAQMDDSLEEENYSHASLILYCSRFYDVASHAVIASTFEDADADDKIIDLVEAQSTTTRPDSNKTKRKGINNDPDFIVNGATKPAGSDSDGDEADEQGDGDGDGTAPLDEEEEEEEEEGDEEEEYGEEERGKTKKRKQSTGRSKSQPAKRRKTTNRNKVAMRSTDVQFALPCELGEELLCRDKQKDHVRSFLLNVINSTAHDGPCASDVSRCLYVSGVPGTGKTATIREVIRDLHVQRNNGELPSFQVLEINAMTMADTNQIYQQLYSLVFRDVESKRTKGGRKKYISGSYSAQCLEEYFAKCDVMAPPKSAHQIIVVLDEMDILLLNNKKQKIMYDLIEWPSRKFSNLSVIGIANTMDLPQRVLPRIGSRLGLNRLVYSPYTRSEIITILKNTVPVKNYSIDESALRLCAAKIGGVSGDIRRAIELCKRANEYLMNTNNHTDNNNNNNTTSGTITAKLMQNAILEAANDYRLLIIAQLSFIEKLIVVAIIKIMRMTGISYDNSLHNNGCTIENIYQTMRDISIKEETHIKPMYVKFLKKLKFEDIEDGCLRLAQIRMIIVEKSLVRKLCRIILNLPVDDCTHALRDSELCQKVLSEQA